MVKLRGLILLIFLFTTTAFSAQKFIAVFDRGQATYYRIQDVKFIGIMDTTLIKAGDNILFEKYWTNDVLDSIKVIGVVGEGADSAEVYALIGDSTFVYNLRIESDSTRLDSVISELAITNATVDSLGDTLSVIYILSYQNASDIADLDSDMLDSLLNHINLINANATDIGNLEDAADSINTNVSDNATAIAGKSPTAGSSGLNTTGTVTTGTWSANVGEMNLINALTSDHTASGKVTSVTVDVNAQGIGAPLTMKADGHYETCDADGASTMVCQVIAMEIGTGTKKVCHYGYMRDDTWNWTSLGQPIYVSTATGALTQTPPAGSGDQVQFVGYAVTADIMFVNPNAIAIERP